MNSKRLSAIRKLLEIHRLDAVLLSSKEDIFYYTGYKATDGFLVIDGGKPALFVSPLENDAEKTKGVEVVYLRSRDLLIKRLKGGVVGYDEESLKTGSFLSLHKHHIKLKKASQIIKQPREIKDGEEIENIKQAIRISKKVLENQKFYSKREIDVANKMEGEIRLAGGTVAFDTIVCNGSASIHHLPDNTIIKKNRPTIIDFGARYNWYACDITRTYPGTDKKWKAAWENISVIQKEIIDSVRPGATMEELQDLFKKLMDKHRYKVQHYFGHGLGLDVHEQITGKLKESMVITVEPGVYLKHQGGIRIEDDILVRKGKPEILSKNII